MPDTAGTTVRPGVDYRDDTFYRPIEKPLETKYGLPDGLLGSIRKNGERTNADVVSSAGARSVYQITPATRDAMQARLNLNAFAGPSQAAEVSAATLADNMGRNDNDPVAAVREYIGGTNPKNWGPVTHDYVQRVTGNAGTPIDVQTVRGAKVLPAGVNFNNMTFEQASSLTQEDLNAGHLMPKAVTPQDIQDKANAKLDPISAARIAGDVTPNLNPTAQPALVQSNADIAQHTADVAAQGTFFDRAGAAISSNWVSSMIMRGASKDHYEGDPLWHQKVESDVNGYLKFAQNEDEVDKMLSARAMHSEADAQAVQADILGERHRQQLINSTGHGTAFNLTSSLLDPVGWLGTMGVGKVLQVGKLGLGLAEAGARAGLAGRVVEGAVTGAAFAGAEQYSGQSMGVSDYFKQMAIGAGIGALIHGHDTFWGKDTSDHATLQAVSDAQVSDAATLKDAVTAKVGPDATPAAIETEMQNAVAARSENTIRASVADRDDADRFLPSSGDPARLGDAQAVEAVAEKHGLDNWADQGDRAIGAEMAQRSDDIAQTALDGGQLDKGLEGKFLKYFGQESDALTLLRAKSSALKATAIQLLESTTGAGGRKASAAVSLVLRERSYNRHLIDMDRSWDLWRKSEGISGTRAMWDGAPRRKFDQQVWDEVWSRGEGAPKIESKPSVVKAADAWEAGMEQMRNEQQYVKTLGHERLGTTSKGYMRQMMSPRKVIALKDANPTGYKNVIKVLSQQFQDHNTYDFIDKEGMKVTKNFDKKFSDDLAKRYLHEAVERGKGTSFVPANINTPEAGSVIQDALHAMKGLDPKEQAAILGRFSRGGANFTKGRLNINMAADIGGGQRMGDLFNQDITQLYRGYARRTAGEVSLAQYGIYGKQGLQMLRSIALSQGASNDEIKALERVSSEFLNEPWGSKGSYDVAFKNLRTVASAAQLGGMGFPQMAEYANAIPMIGVRGTLAAIGSAPRLIKETGLWKAGKEAKNPILNDFDHLYGHIGGDEYLHNRTFDAHDNGVELYDQESLGRATRAVRVGAHFNSVISGFRMIHAVQTRGMAEQITRKAMRYINSGAEDAALSDMGLNPELRAALKANMGDIAKFDKQGNLLSMNLLGDNQLDPRHVQDLMQVIERGARQIIQKTFIGETGKWAHNEVLKSLLQYRTFGVISIEKQYGRQMANYGAIRTFATLVGSMGFAIPIHLARVHAATLTMTRSEAKDYVDKHTTVAALGRSVMNYTSLMGLAPDMGDILATVGDKVGVAPDLMAGAGNHGRTMDAGSYIPSLGYLNDVLKTGQGALEAAGTKAGFNDKPNPGQKFARALKLLPGANAPGFTALVNGTTATEPK